MNVKLGQMMTDFRQNWNYPAKKNFVPYKEVAAYSFGGIGVQMVAAMTGLVAFNASCMLVGATIGIDQMTMYWMNVAATILGFIITPVRGMIFDNTRSKMGKFRPYLLYMGIPSSLLIILLVYLPYDGMAQGQKVAAVFIIYMLIQLCSPFYTVAYDCLVQVISPNTNERTWIISISSIVYSMAPTITSNILPLNIFGGLDHFQTYRIWAPVFCVIGTALGCLCALGTKERIIVSKDYVPRVKFVDGFKKISKNKYFWIIFGSQWIGFMNGGFGYLFMWIFYYGTNNGNIFAVLQLIKGTASLIGMVIAAPLINKFGKKAVCISSTILQAILIAAMIPFVNSVAIVFILMYFKDVAGALSIVYLPAMKADIYDYQQYKTGDRLEGVIEQTGGLLGSVIGLGTSAFIPMVLKSYGLTNNYSDLYNAAFRGPIVSSMIFYGIIGTLMSVLPYFFYNLSEKKRNNMAKVLRIRAMFEDYENGELSEERLVETIDDIREAQAISNRSYETLNKNERQLYDAAQLTIQELNKFSTPELLEEVKLAQYLNEKGPQAMEQALQMRSSSLSGMPKNTQSEKIAYNEALKKMNEMRRCVATMREKYPDGVKIPNADLLSSAVGMPQDTAEEKKLRRQAIKNAEATIHLFTHSAAPYVEAVKLIRQFEAYQKYDEILAQYDNAVEVSLQHEKALNEQRRLEEQEKKLSKQK